MIHIAWPWMILCLPLPWLLRRWLPPAMQQGSALFLPFAAAVSLQRIPALHANSRKRSVLFALMWLLLVASAMRPQWLDDPLPVPTTGRRLLLAVDVSGSMATPDMAGNVSRLNVVQKVAGEFIQNRHGDQVGLILFGTQPYLQAPLTADLDTVSQFLRESVVGVAGTQTAIGDAIGLALKRLHSSENAAGKAGETVLILLTDGGNNAGMMDPLAAARMAADTGLRIYTIGVGAAVSRVFSAPAEIGIWMRTRSSRLQKLHTPNTSAPPMRMRCKKSMRASTSWNPAPDASNGIARTMNGLPGRLRWPCCLAFPPS